VADCLLQAVFPGSRGQRSDGGGNRNGSGSNVCGGIGAGGGWHADPLLLEVVPLLAGGTEPPVILAAAQKAPVETLELQAPGAASAGGAGSGDDTSSCGPPALAAAAIGARKGPCGAGEEDGSTAEHTMAAAEVPAAAAEVLDAEGRRMPATPQLGWEALREAMYLEVREGGPGEAECVV
jgi:hypothetical protein